VVHATSAVLTPEREVTVEAALACASRRLATLDLDVTELLVDDPVLPVTMYVARDRSGAVVARSAGKGRGAQSRASGLFELIEHYYLDWRQRSYAIGEPAFVPAYGVAAQPRLAAANLVQRLGAGLVETPLLCARYDTLAPAAAAALAPAADATVGAAAADARTDNGGIWFPVFMRDPGYLQRMAPEENGGFRQYRHFSGSIGTAAGMSKSEAILHALGELVEHDALSHALAAWYLDHPTRDGTALRRVDPASLRAETAEFYHHAQALVDGELWLLDITSDLGVPAYFAAAADPTALVTEVGLGASMFPEYAAQRALAEVVQATTVHRQDPESSRTMALQSLNRVRRWPWMVRAVRLDLAELAARLPVHPVPLEWTPADMYDVPATLTRLLSRLADKGIGAYVRHGTPAPPASEGSVPAPGEVVVMDVVAVGLETLDLVRMGWPLPPTGRLAGLLAR
jgi:ribosomal protein S12 methylthiotransferase accessory factor